MEPQLKPLLVNLCRCLFVHKLLCYYDSCIVFFHLLYFILKAFMPDFVRAFETLFTCCSLAFGIDVIAVTVVMAVGVPLSL